METANSKPDQLLLDIASYALKKNVGDALAYKLARYCLMDAMGCAFAAFGTPECVKFLGPQVPGTHVPNGARVPGTQFVLDPVKAAFDTACLVRWLDFNDAWWAGGHPSDNVGGILAAADWLSRSNMASGMRPLVMRDVLQAIIKAYEIQCVLTESNKMDRPEIGLDSTFMTKVASAAVLTGMLGGSMEEVTAAVSHAFVDGHNLNIFRTQANAGSRKSWAAADAASRALWIARTALQGEMGYPAVLSAKTWGFCDVLYRGLPFMASRPFGSFAVKNIQYKISFPTQRHAQTAAEAAVRLRPLVKGRLNEVQKIVLNTHQLAFRTINNSVPLQNYAARDHCLQYIAAIGLIFGDITTASYGDEFSADPRIDMLRDTMVVEENQGYTRIYSDKETRANPASIQVFFKDGSKTPKVEIEFPIGDPNRRSDGLPLLEKKFESNAARRFPARRVRALVNLFAGQGELEAMPVPQFMEMLVI